MTEVTLPNLSRTDSDDNDFADVVANDQAILAEVNGGLDSDNFAPTAFGPESGLKWIRGVVDTTTTTPVKGEGFTITINGTGDVSLTFTDAFSDSPAITATANGNDDYTAHLRGSVLGSGARVNVRLAGTLADGVFHFIAYGPA